MHAEKPLSEKHKAFIDEYFCNGFNATQAYRAVYNKATDKSCNEKAPKVLKKVSESQYYILKQQERAKKKEDSYQKNLKRLNLVFEDAMEGDPILDKDGNLTGYRKKDRRAAIASVNEINKMEGNHAETRVKILGDKENPLEFKCELNSRLAKLIEESKKE